MKPETDRAVEMTFAMIKPDAVEERRIGDVICAIEQEGLQIVRLRMQLLTTIDAADFYAVHRDRFFFADLVKFMTSGPVVLMALRGVDAVARWRQLMGPTDSRGHAREAMEATGQRQGDTDLRLRIRFCDLEVIMRNVVHGSDSVESAQAELAMMLSQP